MLKNDPFVDKTFVVIKKYIFLPSLLGENFACSSSGILMYKGIHF